MKEKNLYDHTIIIFSADHWESLGIYNGLCDKNIFMYGETCKIPLIIKQHNQKKGTNYLSQFVGTCDLYSSILHWTGANINEIQRDARSFVPLVNKEPVDDWREYIVTEENGLASILYTQRMLRYKQMKYVFNCGIQMNYMIYLMTLMYWSRK